MAEDTPSPQGQEPVGGSPLTASRTLGNEPSDRGDQTPREGTAPDPSSLNRDQLLQELTRREEALKLRNKEYGLSKNRAVELEKTLQERDREYKRLVTNYQLLQNQRQPQQMRQPVQPQQPNVPQADPYANIPRAQPQPPQFGVDKTVARQLGDAFVSGDEEAATQALNQITQGLYNRWTQDATATLHQAARQNAARQSLQSLAGEFSNDSAFNQRVLENYNRLYSDENEQMLAYGAPEIPMPGVPGQSLNALILKDAIQATRLEALQRTQSTPQSPDSFIEPGIGHGMSGPAVPEGEGRAKIDTTKAAQVVKLLTTDERKYVERTGANPVAWFANLDPRLQEARVREGRPVSREELGIHKTQFTIKT